MVPQFGGLRSDTLSAGQSSVVTQISLSGCKSGDEVDPNNCNGEPTGTSFPSRDN